MLLQRSRPAHARCAAIAVVVGTLALAPNAAADGPYEPNDTAGTAAGPLQGDVVHEAAIDTSNDRDYYAFDATAGRQIVFTLRLHSPCQRGGTSPRHFAIVTASGSIKASEYISASDIDETLTWTVPASGRYYLRTESLYEGCRYRFSATPADALVLPPPIAPPVAVAPQPAPPPTPAPVPAPAPVHVDTDLPVMTQYGSRVRLNGRSASLTIKVNEAALVTYSVRHRGRVIGRGSRFFTSGEAAAGAHRKLVASGFPRSTRRAMQRLGRSGGVLRLTWRLRASDLANNTTPFWTLKHRYGS